MTRNLAHTDIQTEIVIPVIPTPMLTECETYDFNNENELVGLNSEGFSLKGTYEICGHNSATATV